MIRPNPILAAVSLVCVAFGVWGAFMHWFIPILMNPFVIFYALASIRRLP